MAFVCLAVLFVLRVFVICHHYEWQQTLNALWRASYQCPKSCSVGPLLCSMSMENLIFILQEVWMPDSEYLVKIPWLRNIFGCGHWQSCVSMCLSAALRDLATPVASASHSHEVKGVSLNCSLWCSGDACSCITQRAKGLSYATFQSQDHQDHFQCSPSLLVCYSVEILSPFLQSTSLGHAPGISLS